MDYCYHCMAEIKRPESVYCPECGKEHNVHYSQSFELPAGTYLCDKRYFVGKSLGSGGFGITYIGFDVKINKKIVIKETFYSGIFRRNNQNKTLSEPLKVEYDSDISLDDIMNKTQKECFCLSRAESFNNIVKVYDWFAENNTAYIITEYINGDTLYDRVAKVGVYSWDELYTKFKPLLQSLAQLHKMDLLHRDIKPHNIMLRQVFKSREDFVLIDFGLARSSQKSTLATVAAFTPGYSPFEQRTLSKKDGTYTDVYALAATMYYALTGETPNDEVVGDVHDNFPQLKNLKTSGKVPEHVYDAFVSALQPNYRNRCQTIDEFIDELEGDKGYATPIESPYNHNNVRQNSTAVNSRSTQYASNNSPLYKDEVFSGSNSSPQSRTNYAAPQNIPVQTHVTFQPQQPQAPISVPVQTQPQKNKGRKRHAFVNFLIILCVLCLLVSVTSLLDALDIIPVPDFLPIKNETSSETESYTNLPTVTVPNLLEMSKENAKNTLEKSGLKCTVTEQPTDNYDENYVVSQYPMYNMTVHEGDVVDIYVAVPVSDSIDKNSNVEVPNVLDKKYYDAAEELASLGFEVAWSNDYTEDTDANFNTISKQEPKSGTAVRYGSTVTLYVLQHIDMNDYVELGDYVGRNIDEVKTELEEKGFKVTFSTDHNSSEADGTIVKQNFEANKQHEKGKTLNFVVARSVSSSNSSSATASKQSSKSSSSVVSTASIAVSTSNSTSSVQSQSVTHDSGIDTVENTPVSLVGTYSKPVFHGVTSSSHLSAQGSYTYTEQNTLYRNGRCWAEGVDGSGIGEYVMYYDSDVQTVSQCAIVNGYNENWNSFNNNGRLTVVTFEFSDGTSLSYDINPDTMDEQVFYFGRAIQTTYIKVIISDAKDGDKYQDTCISVIIPK